MVAHKLPDVHCCGSPQWSQCDVEVGGARNEVLLFNGTPSAGLEINPTLVL
jgi:hypothetical protein